MVVLLPLSEMPLRQGGGRGATFDPARPVQLFSDTVVWTTLVCVLTARGARGGGRGGGKGGG